MSKSRKLVFARERARRVTEGAFLELPRLRALARSSPEKTQFWADLAGGVTRGERAVEPQNPERRSRFRRHPRPLLGPYQRNARKYGNNHRRVTGSALISYAVASVLAVASYCTRHGKIYRRLSPLRRERLLELLLPPAAFTHPT